jgi:alpha-glucuronidase
MDGQTSTRHTTAGVELKPGDILNIVGHPDGGEPAPLDYVELVPDRK